MVAQSRSRGPPKLKETSCMRTSPMSLSRSSIYHDGRRRYTGPYLPFSPRRASVMMTRLSSELSRFAVRATMA